MNIRRIGSKFWLKIHAREFFTKFTAQLLTFEKEKEADGEFASTSKKLKGRSSGNLLWSAATLSLWVRSGYEAAGEETVYGYEVDTKGQVGRLSMGTKWTRRGRCGNGLWVRSGQEGAGEETVYGYEVDTKGQVGRQSMGTKWTRRGRCGNGLWVRSGHEAAVLKV
jgi:hypothetical protein